VAELNAALVKPVIDECGISIWKNSSPPSLVRSLALWRWPECGFGLPRRVRIPPIPPRRRFGHLSAGEREEISRGTAAPADPTPSFRTSPAAVRAGVEDNRRSEVEHPDAWAHRHLDELDRA
jgi:hypothetical protein